MSSIKDRLKFSDHLDAKTIKTIDSYMRAPIAPEIAEEILTATLRPVKAPQAELAMELPDRRKDTLIGFLMSKGYDPAVLSTMDYYKELLPLANKVQGESDGVI